MTAPATGVVVVRPLAPGDDLQRLGDIVREAYLRLPDYPPDPEYDDTLDKVGDRAAHGRIVVAEIDGELVGCLTFVDDAASEMADFDDPNLTGVRMFGVDLTRQGRGIGLAMMQWCIAETRRLGRHGIGLHTIPEMVAAVRLYERLGFERRPQFDKDFDGTPGLAFVLHL